MIDLYTFTTPNGRKVPIMLEEVGLPYTVHIVHLGRGEQHSPEYLAINPNGKIPAIVDPDGPDGQPLTQFESGAILIYLAEKTGRLLPAAPRDRLIALQWLMFQMGGVGPMFGQASHFLRFAPEKVPYAIKRYSDEMMRLLGVLDRRLGEAAYLAGEYSIADIATYPWVVAVKGLAAEADFASLANLQRWLATVGERPAVIKGMQVPQL